MLLQIIFLLFISHSFLFAREFIHFILIIFKILFLLFYLILKIILFVLVFLGHLLYLSQGLIQILLVFCVLVYMMSVHEVLGGKILGTAS